LINIKINTNYVRKILSIIRNEDTNRRNINKIIWCSESFNIYLHDKTLGRKSTPKVFKYELLNLHKENQQEGIYCLNDIKDKLNDIENCILEIENKEDFLLNVIPKKIEKYVALDNFSRIRAVLYPVGFDGGFSLMPRVIFMNVRKYSKDFESFTSIFAHEVYHARKRKFSFFTKFTYNQYFCKDRHYHKTLGWIVEEGIASLIELGTEMDYTSLSSVTPKELDKIEGYFKILNTILINDVSKNQRIEEIVKEYHVNKYILNYVVGYWIAKSVFEYSGIGGLNWWTINHDYKNVLKLYILSCKSKSENSYLDKEIEKMILDKTSYNTTSEQRSTDKVKV